MGIFLVVCAGVIWLLHRYVFNPVWAVRVVHSLRTVNVKLGRWCREDWITVANVSLSGDDFINALDLEVEKAKKKRNMLNKQRKWWRPK